MKHVSEKHTSDLLKTVVDQGEPARDERVEAVGGRREAQGNGRVSAGVVEVLESDAARSKQCATALEGCDNLTIGKESSLTATSFGQPSSSFMNSV